MGSAEDGEGEGFEACTESGFFSAAVAVAQGVEVCRVVHLCEVRKFMAYNIVTQFLRQEYKRAAEGDSLAAAACAECAQPSSDLPFGGCNPYAVRYLFGARQQYSGCIMVRYAAQRFADSRYSCLGVKVNFSADLYFYLRKLMGCDDHIGAEVLADNGECNARAYNALVLAVAELRLALQETLR